MLRRTLAATSLLLVSACTLIYVAGDANRIADSGNHSGTLSVPPPNAERVGRLPRIDKP